MLTRAHGMLWIRVGRPEARSEVHFVSLNTVTGTLRIAFVETSNRRQHSSRVVWQRQATGDDPRVGVPRQASLITEVTVRAFPEHPFCFLHCFVFLFKCKDTTAPRCSQTYPKHLHCETQFFWQCQKCTVDADSNSSITCRLCCRRRGFSAHRSPDPCHREVFPVVSGRVAEVRHRSVLGRHTRRGSVSSRVPCRSLAFYSAEPRRPTQTGRSVERFREVPVGARTHTTLLNFERGYLAGAVRLIGQTLCVRYRASHRARTLRPVYAGRSVERFP